MELSVCVSVRRGMRDFHLCAYVFGNVCILCASDKMWLLLKIPEASWLASAESSVSQIYQLTHVILAQTHLVHFLLWTDELRIKHYRD